MELIIFDDSPDKYPFVISDPRIRYVHDNTRRYMIWEKRNILNNLATGDIIVCMDDDDFYSTERVSHAVDRLANDKKHLLAGCNQMYIYDVFMDAIYRFKSYPSTRISNNTFAYKRELLHTAKYSATKYNFQEEMAFTNNYTTRFINLDDEKSLICVNHNTNTINKDKFFRQQIPNYPRELLYPILDLFPTVYWINGNKTRHLSNIGNVIHVSDIAVCVATDMRKYVVVCKDDVDLRDTTYFYDIVWYYVQSIQEEWDILRLHTLYCEACHNDTVKTISWRNRSSSELISVIRTKTDLDRKDLKVYEVNIPYFRDKNSCECAKKLNYYIFCGSK